ncbi:MAG TPA: hypothetical protein EYH31_08295, partial [Anaerolineae bacterium]|nr:hypothetical protein [Anaerolineae bacterium]
MVLIDSDILSILSKVNRLDLLFAILGENLAVSPDVQREPEVGVDADYAALKPAVDLIQQGCLSVVSLGEA